MNSGITFEYFTTCKQEIVSTLHSRTQKYGIPENDHPCTSNFFQILDSHSSTNESHNEHGEESGSADNDGISSRSSCARSSGADSSGASCTSRQVCLTLNTTFNDEAGEI